MGLRRGVAVVVLGLVVGTAPAGAGASVPAPRPQPEGWSVDGRVYATVVVGGTVYLGGRFTRVTAPDGTAVARHNLAALSLADGSPVTSWRADTDAVVRALESDGTSLWVGGYFDHVGGLARRGLAKVGLRSAEVDPAFHAGIRGGLDALDLEGERLYVGGRFSEVGGLLRAKVAKLDASTGTPVRRFRAAVRGPAFALRADPASARLYVGGAFSEVQGKPREGAAVLDGRTGRLRSQRLRDTRRPVLALDISSDGRRLYAGDGKNRVVAWRARTGARMWGHRTRGNVQAVLLVQGRVYFGFHEGTTGHPAARVAAAAARSGRMLDWYPRFRGYWGVYGIAADRDHLLVGGQFRRVEGVPARGWAVFDR